MDKMLIFAALTLSSLLSASTYAAPLANASVIVRNATYGANEMATFNIRGQGRKLGPQQQTTITVPAGVSFVMKVDNIIVQNSNIKRDNFLGCYVGVNMSLQSGQNAMMTMTANTNPVNKNSIFSCTFTK